MLSEPKHMETLQMSVQRRSFGVAERCWIWQGMYSYLLGFWEFFFFLTELFKQRQSSTSVLWCRMENSVLGNALEGVPEGDEDEKPQESNVEGTENVDGAWIMLKVKRSTLKVVGWFGFWGEDQWQDFRISLKCTLTFTGQLKLGTPFIQLQLENSKFVYTKYRNHK